MANREHLHILRQGIDVWNDWHYKYRSVQVDLSGADLSEAVLIGAKLFGADLSSAVLSRAVLTWANLIGADLRGANLSGADLSGTRLFGADLRRADLRGAGFIGARLNKADLSEADLRGANLSGADLSGAVLFGANLSGAVLERAKLSSQSQLQKLAFQLSDEQLFSILFEDEIAFAKAGRAEGNNKEPILRLIIGGKTPWTFLDMAGLLLAIQVSYNNMHYLVTTEDLDIEHIRAQLTNFRRLVGVEDNIKVQSIRSGSLLVEISNLAIANKEIIGCVLVAIGTYITALMRGIAKYKEATAKQIEATAKSITAEAEAERIRAEAELKREEARKLRAENQKLEDAHLKSDSTALAQLTATSSVATSEYLTAHPCPEPSIEVTLSRIQVTSPTVEQNKYELFTKATHSLITMSFKLEELGHDRIQYEIVKKHG